MKIRLLVSFAGQLGEHDSPRIGEVIDVPEGLADALCDGERAERVGKAAAVVEAAATKGAPERAMKPSAKARKA